MTPLYFGFGGVLLTITTLLTALSHADTDTLEKIGLTMNELQQIEQFVSNRTHLLTHESVPASSLSQEEIHDIVYMREEEKLARDVYLTLGEKWGSRIFDNIAQSEQIHLDALGSLILKYNLADPLQSGRGEFTNKDLERLYNELVTEGNISRISALTVGARIEELDIKDLTEALTHTNAPDVTRVYENLTTGSKNHLQAFAAQLDRMGESYEPVYLDEETYQEIQSDNTRNGAGMQHGGQGYRVGRS